MKKILLSNSETIRFMCKYMYFHIIRFGLRIEATLFFRIQHFWKAKQFGS